MSFRNIAAAGTAPQNEAVSGATVTTVEDRFTVTFDGDIAAIAPVGCYIYDSAQGEAKKIIGWNPITESRPGASAMSGQIESAFTADLTASDLYIINPFRVSRMTIIGTGSTTVNGEDLASGTITHSRTSGDNMPGAVPVYLIGSGANVIEEGI